MDLKQDKISDSGSIKKSSNNSSTKIKSCTYCHTTITPLWRGGPFGPKSLCNACGIKYNKKKRESLFGIDKPKKEKTKKKNNKKITKHKHAVSGGKNGIKNNKRNELFHKLKMRLMALGTDIREEEQAALLLMALSCGSVYA
ncbi:hypothetical protein LIER_00239 [Lithospermum erythrorhizon]|uniref:GATA-type domain-containing protein n=1 Tax=Lithospermum erythrorhizon TaxID=34254 RepID=A0AAV3NHS6_LITER